MQRIVVAFVCFGQQLLQHGRVDEVGCCQLFAVAHEFVLQGGGGVEAACMGVEQLGAESGVEVDILFQGSAFLGHRDIALPVQLLTYIGVEFFKEF